MNTRHQEISRHLRDRIEDGTYPAGAKIPAIPALMEEFGVARDTVRDAVARLTNEGLVTPLRGIGTVVRDVSPVALAYTPSETSVVWAKQTGSGPNSDRVMQAEWTTPDKDITQRLDIPAGSQVVHRIRHQSKGKQVAQIHEQWIPDHIANIIEAASSVDLANAEVVPPTDLYSLMRQGGEDPSTVTETIHTRMPDPEEAGIMEMPPGVPVIITYRITRNGASVPLETSTFVGAGDRMSHSFTVPITTKK